MEQKKKLNFWILLWKRITGRYYNFFNMFDEMSLEPEEGRKVDWTVARTIIQFAVSFGVIGAIVWVLKKIYPQSTLINKIFNFGTPIAILILLIV